MKRKSEEKDNNKIKILKKSSNDKLNKQTPDDNLLNDQTIELNEVNCSLNEDKLIKELIEEDNGWISYNKTVYGYKFKFDNDNLSNKIASFDMDGTLITTKSKNKFAIDLNDWKLLSGAIKPKIAKLIKDKFNFVVFSNQTGITYGHAQLNDIKKKFENIIKFIDLPCIVIFCTSVDKFRKPATGMLDFYKKIINRDDLDLDNSFYVGDAMGRPKDHSAADLLFSFNCKLKFLPIESFLSGFERPKLFNWNQLSKLKIPKFPTEESPSSIGKIILKGKEDKELNNINELLDNLKKLKEDGKLNLIFLIGMNGSGKTHFVNNYLKNEFRCINNGDDDLFKNYINQPNDKGIVIDDLNLDLVNRKNWFDLIKKDKNINLIAIYFNIKIDQCYHNIHFRKFFFKNNQQTLTKFDLFKQRNKFQFPNLSEGFNLIYHLEFIPNFKLNQNLKDKYYQFLVSKS